MTPQYQTFLSSMKIGLEEWRDGIGYNLDALAELTGAERDSLVRILAEHLQGNPDWRDVEALGAIGNVEAKAILRRTAASGNHDVRARAARALIELGEPADLESAIIFALRGSSLGNGMSQALDMAEEHPTPLIRETLLDLARNGDEGQRIHCAALALYLGGQADEAFDWNHRPFFLQFGDPDRQVQLDAYNELRRRLALPALTEES